MEITSTIDGTKLKKVQRVLLENSQEIENGLIFIPNFFERGGQLQSRLQGFLMHRSNLGLYPLTGELQAEHLFQEKGKIMIRTAFFHLLIKHQHLKQILKEIMIQDMEQIGR